MQRLPGILCASWLLSILVFAPGGAGQQSGSPAAGSPPTSSLHSPASKVSDKTSGVTLKDSRLSVNVQNRSLELLADEISGKAGVPIVLTEEVGSQLVSVNFQNLPLDEGLRQILKKYDAFFFYGVDEQEPSLLKVVWVYPKGRGRGIAPVPAEKWASTKELEAMLADKDPEVRGRAIETLAERKGEGALEAVLQSLGDDNQQVRARALYGAMKAGMEVSEGVLINLAVNDGSPDVRVLALQALSKSPDVRTIAERALNDSSEPVRVQAHEILAQLDEETNESRPPTQSSADKQQENQPPENH